MLTHAPLGTPSSGASSGSRVLVDAHEARTIFSKVRAAGAHGLPPRGAPNAHASGGHDRRTSSNDPRMLSNYGGPTLVTANSINVYVNCDASCWGTPSTFLTNLSASGMIHLVDQYVNSTALNRYPFAQSANVGYTVSGRLSDSDIFAIIHQVAGSLGTGYGKIYHVFLPQGTEQCSAIVGGCYSPSSPSQWTYCAYHGNTTFSDIGHVLYSVEPYQNVSADYNGNHLTCQSTYQPNGAVVDSTASTLSHELFETITDPDWDTNRAWYNFSYGEIGDICRWVVPNGTVTLNGVAYGIQEEYSNSEQNCSFGPASPPFEFVQMTGHGTDIAIGPGSQAWTLGLDFPDGQGNYQVYGYNPATTVWTGVSGAAAARIAVSPAGTPWVVTADGRIFKYNGASFGQIPGHAVDIGVGPNEDAWCVGRDYPDGLGNYQIFHYSAQTTVWTPVSGAYAARIAVSPDTGTPWVVTADGRIFRYNGSSFAQIPGLGTDIGVGPNGIAWTLGLQFPDGHGNYQVFSYSPGTNTWTASPNAAAANIAVSPEGTPWVVTSDGSIFKHL